MSGPLMQLLSQGMRLWLTSICSELEQLDLDLDGSALGLFAGHLQGGKLTAKGVVFQNLALANVELQSDPIDFEVGGLIKKQKLQLKHKFQIQGCVTFSAANLNKSLANPHWLSFSNNIASQLLGANNLAGYAIAENKLSLHSGDGRSIQCNLEVLDGMLWLQPIDSKSTAAIAAAIAVPMDPAIRLENVTIEGQQLKLTGSSIVSAGAAGSK